MSTQFVVKNKSWIPGKSTAMKVPAALISVNYEDDILVKLTPDKRAVFEQALAKQYTTSEKDTLKMMEARMRTTLSTADAAIAKADAAKKKSIASRAEMDVASSCRDLERGLATICDASVSGAYKTAMNGVALLPKVGSRAQVKMQGKLTLTAEEGGESESEGTGEANHAEDATKLLETLVYPLQDDGADIVADSKAASPVLEKAIKESNALSKLMREQAKKPVPANAVLIKTTATSLHKNLQTAERLATGCQMKVRQLGTRLVSLDQKTKEMKNAAVTAGVQACLADGKGIADLLGSFPSVKSIVDQLAKPFDGKTVPDFGKLITVLNRLQDPRPSQELTTHLTKLGDAVAAVAKG